MHDALGMRRVHRGCNLRDEGHRSVERRRRVVAHRDIEGLGRHILLSQKWHVFFDSSFERGDHAAVNEPHVDQTLKGFDERAGLFGGDVEMERLHRHQPVLRRLIGTIDGTEDTHSDLVHHPERAEGTRGGKRTGVVAGQRWNSCRAGCRMLARKPNRGQYGARASCFS